MPQPNPNSYFILPPQPWLLVRRTLARPAAHTQKTINPMDLQERIAQSETRIFKAVFPNTTNHYDTLFGGTAMQLMDEVAFIAATRFCRKRVVTVSSDRIDFTQPIPAGTIVELVARVVSVGNTSRKVQVEIFVEEMSSDTRTRAVTGSFAFVAIDEHKQPVQVLAEKAQV